MSKPVKKLIQEQKIQSMTNDPQNSCGHDFLRQKYGLPMPNKGKYGRAQGAFCNNDLERLGVGAIKCKKVSHPKRILPKYFRNDPFADPPPITEDDIADGMFSLLNRGIIPRAVDLSPAFERGSAPFIMQRAQILTKDKMIPPSKTQLNQPPKAINYVSSNIQDGG